MSKSATRHEHATPGTAEAPTPRPIRADLTPAITELQWDADTDAHLKTAYEETDSIVEAAARFRYHSYDSIHKRLLARGIHEPRATIGESTPAPDGSPSWLPCDPAAVMAGTPVTLEHSLAELCDEIGRHTTVVQLHQRLPCNQIRRLKQLLADLGLIENGDLVTGATLDDRLAYLRAVDGGCRYVVKPYNGTRPTTAHVYDPDAENSAVCEYLPAGNGYDAFSNAERRQRGLAVCKWCSGEADRSRNPDWGAYHAARSAAEGDD